MANIDYTALGLKAGLEIHQQLNTRKLFCNCDSEIRDDAPDKSIKRILRASAGESGDVDLAAKSESEKGKYFVYEYYNTNCLVEIDESPPLPINKDALNVVLQFSKLVNAEFIDQVHVMRKTVVDGSNTSGFQRTALIARDGSMDVELSDKSILKVGVDTVCIEEDAARIISRSPDFDVYRLDRLGMPLIEVATAPDMSTPQQVKDVATFIGMLLRSTGKVKRGLGTIRQDVNVSIKDGVRVEIKGCQDLRLIDKIVEFEVLRQSNLLKLRDEILLRKIKHVDFEVKDFTEYFTNTQSSMIKKNLDSGLKIFGAAIKNFKGFFGFEINPNRRFGSELSDKIKVFGLNGLIHTDEDLNKYKIVDDVKNIYETLKLLDSDSMIFIIGNDSKCIMAFDKIANAINSFIHIGLSKEVRNAKDDGTSVFLRPMPGSARMYPETDVPHFAPDLSNIEMPELIKDKIDRLSRDYVIPRQVAKELIYNPEFELFAKKYPQIKAITIAETLVTYPKEIMTLHKIEIDPLIYADKIFNELNIHSIDSSSVKEILINIAKGADVEETISRFKLADESEIADFIVKLLSKHPGMNPNSLMGEVMKVYRGKFSGQKILELVKKYSGE